MNDAAQPLIRLDKVTNTPAARSTCSTGRWWTAPCEAKLRSVGRRYVEGG